MAEEHEPGKPRLFLNIIWHQHQPLYLDPASDQLQGPWVRTHGTKDYYDMTSILERYPEIHAAVNLTSSLLTQLQTYYVDRLGPFVDVRANRVDATGFLSRWKGKTDPWIDLALTPTSQFRKPELDHLLRNTWNAFGVSEVMIGRFPEYRLLREKYRREGERRLSEQDRREIKFWFYIAHFDPGFLGQPVTMVTGERIDLTDIVERTTDGTYRLRVTVTEELCNRIVAETWKVLSAIVPLHKKMMYRPDTGEGQIEVITTPFYHPILPLLYDSDLARICQPSDPLPKRFCFPEDGNAQVQMAVLLFERMFGVKPKGMWPAEGSVAHEIVTAFSEQGIRWIATDEKILARSQPSGLGKFSPYAISPLTGQGSPLAVVFRDTELSDRIGFVYKNWNGRDAANDLLQRIVALKPPAGEADRLLTIILDGENAWEWYQFDNDGKEFQNQLYQELTKLQQNQEVTTVTVSEYLDGNQRRGIPAHPVSSLQVISRLWPGSWINANFDTWIGEEEENRAWEYLLQARTDLARSGLRPPDLALDPPPEGTKEWFALKAWQALYAAEGSDWFWWYGTDQTAPAGDKPFDVAFLTLLQNVYRFAEKAGFSMPKRDFHPIVGTEPSVAGAAGGTMAQSASDLVRVVFQCDARHVYVRRGIFIVGNHELLGNWVPNKVRLFDDGTHGDRVGGDGIWTLELQVPAGTNLQYKFTNSGPLGGWYPGEEFPSINRSIVVPEARGESVILLDTFGSL